MNEKKIEATYLLNYFQANIEKLNELRNFVLKNKSKINLLGKKEIKNLKHGNLLFVQAIKTIVYGKAIMITNEKNIQEHKKFYSLLVELCEKLNIHINSILINKKIYLTPNNFILFLEKENKITIMPYHLIYFLNTLKSKQYQLLNSTKNKIIYNRVNYVKMIKYII